LSLGSAAILARALGPENRGLFGLALLVPNIVTILCILGQETVNATFAGLYKDKRSNLFQQSILITLFAAVAGTLIICTFYFWLPVEKGQFGRLSPQVVLLSCIATPVLVSSRALLALVRGSGKILTASVIYVIQTIILLVLLLIFLVICNAGLKAAMVAWYIGPITAIVLSMWTIRKYVTFNPSNFSMGFFKKSLIFGGQTSLASLAGFLILRINQGILAYMMPAGQVGLYIVAAEIAEGLTLLPRSISIAFLSHLANELPTRQSQVPMVFRCTVIISLFSMSLFGAFGIPVMVIFYGREYVGSILPFLLLLPGIASLGGAGILASDLFARNKPKYSICIGYSILVINIVFCLILVPMIGIVGAALANSITYICASFLWLIFYRHQSKVPLREMVPKVSDFSYIIANVKSFIDRKSVV
jgi:O-antigen/teichoic acid export membrane protein